MNNSSLNNPLNSNAAQWCNNVTNCLSRVPQRLKFEFNAGAVTVKAGSIIYNGRGTGAAVAADLTTTSTGSSAPELFVFVNKDLSALYLTDYTNNTLVYDNDTGFYSDGNVEVYPPVGIVTASSGTYTGIKRTFTTLSGFNGWVFKQPQVQARIATGVMPDGSIKSEFFGDNIGLRIKNNVTKNITIGLNSGGLVDYDATPGAVRIGYVTCTGGLISDIAGQTVFEALDANDKVDIAGWPLPDYSTAITICTQSNQSDVLPYTAPCAGYILQQTAPSSFTHVTINGVDLASGGSITNTGIIPVNRGDIVTYHSSSGNWSLQFLAQKGR